MLLPTLHCSAGLVPDGSIKWTTTTLSPPPHPPQVAPLLPEKRIVATWSDSGSVHVWDITKHALLIDAPGGAKGGMKATTEQPIYSFAGHQVCGVCVCVCVCVWCVCPCVHVCACVRVCVVCACVCACLHANVMCVCVCVCLCVCLVYVCMHQSCPDVFKMISLNKTSKE